MDKDILKKEKKKEYNRKYRLKQLEKLKENTKNTEKEEEKVIDKNDKDNFFLKMRDNVINQGTMLLLPVAVKLILGYCLKKSRPKQEENITTSSFTFS
jgi:hypothetical protein